MLPRSSLHTSRRSRRDILILLSGESSSLPAAEARALVLSEDGGARFDQTEERVLVARTTADPDVVARRVAFSRRVGSVIRDGRFSEEQLAQLAGATYKVRGFTVGGRGDESAFRERVSTITEQTDARVDLRHPDFEVTMVEGGKGARYYSLTRPSEMTQTWTKRRPRARAFFHPAAIFPKLSRALVNLSRVRPGEVFLDPFVGTGSLLLEASMCGALPVGIDLSRKMVHGAMANQRKFQQEWLGVIRADSAMMMPLRAVDAIATDVPYGRVSSTAGVPTGRVIDGILKNAAPLLRPGRRMVVMHPDSVPIGPGTAAGFQVEEEHQIYIHRKLTRAITVLRRVSE